MKFKWETSSRYQNFPRAISNDRRRNCNVYEVLRGTKCHPRTSSPAKLPCVITTTDITVSHLKYQNTKHHHSPTQKTAGKAVKKGLDQHSLARSTHPEGENTFPEHLKNYPSSRQTMDRESQASKNRKTTRSPEPSLKANVQIKTSKNYLTVYLTTQDLIQHGKGFRVHSAFHFYLLIYF